ncbi:MAG: phage terminase large subunit family protein [Giesbergeria sp.]|nr:phage terminase large subunit family protein [Giesbergeria sp.]
MPLADAAACYRGSFTAGLRPDPPLWVDEWVDEHAYIPAEGNAEPGKYDTARTPFARQVMRVLSPGHPANRVVVMGASQLLKTQSAMNWMMASVDGAAANILALMPTLDLARRLSARINNTIKATPKVRGLFSEPRSRHGKNTDDTKTFRGGTVYISTAGSAANLAEIPARYGYGDEIDDWEDDLQGQGDPIEIFENRGSTYGRNRKWYYSSSPKRPKEMSKIWQLFLRGNQQHYHLPCPHCDHLHELLWENVRADEALSRAWMVCPECGGEIEESHKGQMLRDEAMGGQARWVAYAESVDGTESFTISQLYAPTGWTSWLELARLHRQAEDALREGDHTKMAAFWNTRLARCYDIAQSVTSADKLKARAEPYPPRVVPDPALVLTMAVDTQPDRLELQIEAWGPGMEHWIVDHQVLPGSPAIPPSDPASVWAALDRIVTTPLVHASGALIKISAYGIDSGGHNTQDVYNYATQRRHLHCVILAGARKPHRPIMASKPSNQDVDWGGKVRQGMAELWFVGTDVAKDYLFNRIDVTSGPGAMHWHNQMPAEWYDQMCAERLVPVMRNGQIIRVWRKLNDHARNEALDISVYGLAMAHKLRLHTWSHADWERLREKLIPRSMTPDLFAVPQPPQPADFAEIQVPKVPQALDTQAREAIKTEAKEAHETPVAAYIPPAPPATGRRIYSRGIA